MCDHFAPHGPPLLTLCKFEKIHVAISTGSGTKYGTDRLIQYNVCDEGDVGNYRYLVQFFMFIGRNTESKK